MQNKNTNENPTAPKEVTVAKTAKEAAIDPKTGDEIIGMDIELFDSNTDEVVKCDELEKRIRLVMSRMLHYVIKHKVMVNSKDDAEKFNELLANSTKQAMRYSYDRIYAIAETCDILGLKATITLDESVCGIKQIIIEYLCNFCIITENCYAHLDGLFKGKKEFFGPDGKFTKAGNKLLRSEDYYEIFDI